MSEKKTNEIFFTEYIMFHLNENSGNLLNNILYIRDDTTQDYINVTEKKCLNLLKKIYYTNHIFNYDYFKNSDSYTNKINEINPQ